MTTFKVWEEGKDAVQVEAADMNEALDKAAEAFGFVDYADMAQEKNWSEDQGLNITAN